MVDEEVGSEVCDDAGGGVRRRGEVETVVFANAADCADRVDRAPALALGVAGTGSRMGATVESST